MAQKPAAGPAARPLSPHLQIFRWPITMTTSILHRMTGVALGGGALLIAWWLIAAATGADAYGFFAHYANEWYGRIVLFVFTVFLVFHLLNGIRHLVWDTGRGFEVKTANRSGLLVVILTVLLTIGLWALGYWVKGELPL